VADLSDHSQAHQKIRDEGLTPSMLSGTAYLQNPTGLRHIFKTSMCFQSTLKLIPAKNKHVTIRSTAGPKELSENAPRTPSLLLPRSLTPKEAFSPPL